LAEKNEENTELKLQREAKNDGLLRVAKIQGYVVDGCYLPGAVVMFLVNKGEGPCKGCNNDRSVCGGKPRG